MCTSRSPPDMPKCNHATGWAFKISSRMLSRLFVIFGEGSEAKLSHTSCRRMLHARSFSSVKTERSLMPWPSSMKSFASCITMSPPRQSPRKPKIWRDSSTSPKTWLPQNEIRNRAPATPPT